MNVASDGTTQKRVRLSKNHTRQSFLFVVSQLLSRVHRSCVVFSWDFDRHHHSIKSVIPSPQFSVSGGLSPLFSSVCVPLFHAALSVFFSARGMLSSGRTRRRFFSFKCEDDMLPETEQALFVEFLPRAFVVVSFLLPFGELLRFFYLCLDGILVGPV